MNASIGAVAAPITEGGLDHLVGAISTLEDDFLRIDAAISDLRDTLRLDIPSSEPEVEGDVEQSPRSIIEQIIRRVMRLQDHSAHQRRMIERIRESIQ